MTPGPAPLKSAIEALIFSASAPVSTNAIKAALKDFWVPESIQPEDADNSTPQETPDLDAQVKTALASLREDYASRAVNLVEVASGYRFQVGPAHANWVFGLQQEKPQRYSRALLETLALIAYRQPITRGEIEDIRGVAVSSHIIKTLLERKWIRVVGHRDLPGRPAMFATSRDFLDYFNLASLEALPSLAEIKALDGEEEKDDQPDVSEPVEPIEASDVIDEIDKTEQAEPETDVEQKHETDEQQQTSAEPLTFAALSQKFEDESLKEESVELEQVEPEHAPREA